ncbi:MAG: SsrA-binding protein SmpB [Chloroflexi bacterium]|nr:SsrA-binding protein SmpB [Chloroflexota bacterium]NOG34673.1 SsrA-binding protein SmpB [Chloroflexota bacterium]GIK57735.1 MAG: SsrA-binding protein [Chloroflexota bacterium]
MKVVGKKIVAQNKRANFEYELLTKYEAGLVLLGTEIKSIRNNQVSLQRSYIQARDGELWLVEAHIAEYKHGNRENHDPVRPRKLLLKRREIAHILDSLQQKGLTCVPTILYLKDGRAKIEIALARGKKLHDKRDSLAKRDTERQVERALREKYR